MIECHDKDLTVEQFTAQWKPCEPEKRGVGDGILKELEGIRLMLPMISAAGGYDYPRLANGQFENVIAFNNNEHIKLKPADQYSQYPYFSSEGTLTDLQHRDIPGTKVLTTFPATPEVVAGSSTWPNRQANDHFNRPPVDNTNVTANGYSKQFYSFNCGQDFFVTVGPSLPKITKIPAGGAQFWVGSIGTFTQGKGKFENVRGVSVYVGSAYLPEWPDDPNAQVAILEKGFDARIGTYFKYVPVK